MSHWGLRDFQGNGPGNRDEDQQAMSDWWWSSGSIKGIIHIPKARQAGPVVLIIIRRNKSEDRS